MKVYLDSVGCRLNQSEIERMALQLLHSGHRLVSRPEECNLAIINTCTVTSAAASDSRNRARRVHRRNPGAQIVLTGCWSELEPSAAAQLPGVAKAISNAAKDRLITDLCNIPPDFFDHKLLVRQPIPGLTTSNVLRPGLAGLIKNLSFEIAPVRINGVAPGRFATERVRQLDSARAESTGQPIEDVRRQMEATIPLGRYGDPAEIGRVAAFLLSPAASYVTGAIVPVDGGLVSALP